MIRSAKEEEIDLLTELSKKAFDSDIEYGSQGCGPTGYNSSEWYLKKLKENVLYVFECDNQLIGGAVINERSNKVYIHRLFIDSKLFLQGYGTLFMKEIEEYFLDAMTFCLDTPEWNMRTNKFYKKCGYKIAGKVENSTFMLNLYEKSR